MRKGDVLEVKNALLGKQGQQINPGKIPQKHLKAEVKSTDKN